MHEGVRLSIGIKHGLNIELNIELNKFVQFLIQFLGSLEPNTGDISYECKLILFLKSNL